MKFLIVLSLMMSQLSFSKQAEREEIGSPPNAVSRGQAENAGISEDPSGTSPEEAKELRTRAESMGGAPNAGAGTGTGTGAGSTVGEDLEGDGTVTAGATSGEAAEE